MGNSMKYSVLWCVVCEFLRAGKMKKLKQLILLAALLAFAMGCHNSRSLWVQGFENCYQNNYNGIDTLIQIDGYYELATIFNGDTLIKNLIFSLN